MGTPAKVFPLFYPLGRFERLKTVLMGNYLTHASLGWFGKNKHVDVHHLSSKSANSDFPFTLYVLARQYHRGVRGRHFPLR